MERYQTVWRKLKNKIIKSVHIYRCSINTWYHLSEVLMKVHSNRNV